MSFYGTCSICVSTLSSASKSSRDVFSLTSKREENKNADMFNFESQANAEHHKRNNHWLCMLPEDDRVLLLIPV